MIDSLISLRQIDSPYYISFIIRLRSKPAGRRPGQVKAVVSDIYWLITAYLLLRVNVNKVME